MSKNKELWKEAAELIGAGELNRRFHNWITGLMRRARANDACIKFQSTYETDIATIIADLNQRTKKRFTTTSAANSAIIRLLKQNYTVEDFKRVHEAMAALWLNDETMNRYLRPSTLYRPSKFDEYLAEWHRMETQRVERDQARQRTQRRTDAARSTDRRKEAELIRELNSVPWHSFDTWKELLGHVMKFPTAESADNYDMPSPLHSCRKRKGILLDTLSGNIPASVSETFQRLKSEVSQ